MPKVAPSGTDRRWCVFFNKGVYAFSASVADEGFEGKSGAMNAWEMVAGWADEYVRSLREQARLAANAYSTGEVADACNAYAAALAVAASVIERDAQAFRAKAKLSSGEL